MATRTLVTVASVGSAGLICGALITLGYIFNDLRDFHSEALGEIQQFKVHLIPSNRAC